MTEKYNSPPFIANSQSFWIANGIKQNKNLSDKKKLFENSTNKTRTCDNHRPALKATGAADELDSCELVETTGLQHGTPVLHESPALARLSSHDRPTSGSHALRRVVEMVEDARSRNQKGFVLKLSSCCGRKQEMNTYRVMDGMPSSRRVVVTNTTTALLLTTTTTMMIMT